MTKAGKPPTYTEKDFKKWYNWKQSGVEDYHIAQRAGCSETYVQRRIKEIEDEIKR